jgi:hypothetical protein
MAVRRAPQQLDLQYIKATRVNADIGLVAAKARELNKRESALSRGILLIGLLIVFALFLQLGSWRTYSGHGRYQRHYLWEASGLEIAVHAGIPLVVSVLVVLFAVRRGRRTRKVTGDRQPNPFGSS